MHKVQKIMVAIDFSNHSLPALKYAVTLARDLKAELLLANVINQRDIDMMHTIQNNVPSFNAKEQIAELRQTRVKMFGELLAEADCADLQVTTRVAAGTPYQELLAIIKAEGPDLLVMPTKGRGNLADTIVGSCAQKMFRRCPVPLLTLRPENET